MVHNLFTRDIINNLKEKYRQFRIYKCTNFVIALESFKRLRALTKNQIKEAYSTYEQTIQNNLQTQPQDLWKFVNQKRKHSRIPGIMEYENTQLFDTSQILDAFGSFFRSVYEQKQDNWDGCPVQLPLNCVSLIGIDESDVLNALRKLKTNVTAGPDSVPLSLLETVQRSSLNHLLRFLTWLCLLILSPMPGRM